MAQVLRTFSSRVVAMILGVAAGVLVARLLGAEGRGHYAVIVSIATIATSLGHLSVDQSQAQLYTHEPQSRVSLAANSVYLGLAWGTVVAAVTFGIVSVFDSNFPVYATSGLLIGMIYIPLATGTLWVQRSLLLRGRMSAFNRGPVLSALVMIVGVGALGSTGHLTVTALVLVWAVSVGPTLVWGAWSLRTRLRDVDLKLGVRTVQLGLRYHPGKAAFLLLRRVDVLILNGLASARLVGLYTLAVSVAELINLMTNSVANVLTGRQFGGTDAESVQATALSARINLVVGAVLGLGLVAVAPVLVPFVYGTEFRASVPALLALVPGIVILAWVRGVDAYFVRRNKPLLVSLLGIGSVVLNVALNFLLIPLWGIVGASVASSLTYLGYAVACVIAFARLASVSWRQVLPSSTDLRQLAAYLRTRVLRRAGSGAARDGRTRSLQRDAD